MLQIQTPSIQHSITPIPIYHSTNPSIAQSSNYPGSQLPNELKLIGILRPQFIPQQPVPVDGLVSHILAIFR